MLSEGGGWPTLPFSVFLSRASHVIFGHALSFLNYRHRSAYDHRAFSPLQDRDPREASLSDKLGDR